MCNSDLVLLIDQASGGDIWKKCDVRASDRLHDITHPKSHNALDIGETRQRTGTPTPLACYEMRLPTIIGNRYGNTHHNAEINEMLFQNTY